AALPAALPAGERAARQTGRPEQRFRPNRYRHLGGGGRRRRPLIGGEIDERHVGFVPDRGDQRDHAVGGGAHDDLLVERPQVLERAAPARDDDEVRSRNSPPPWPPL